MHKPDCLGPKYLDPGRFFAYAAATMKKRIYLYGQWFDATVLPPQRSPDLAMISFTSRQAYASDPTATETPRPKPVHRRSK